MKHVQEPAAPAGQTIGEARSAAPQRLLARRWAAAAAFVCTYPFLEWMAKKEGLGGLGLSICLAIVEAHRGRVWLHSNKAGAIEFRFSLPLEPPIQT